MKKILLVAILLSFSVIGCSGIEPPGPGKLLTHPLGTSPLRMGMTKSEVKAIWGEPNLIQNKNEGNDKGLTSKEEWVYYGSMNNLPINYGHLSKTVHIYFDGDNITNFKEE